MACRNECKRRRRRQWPIVVVAVASAVMTSLVSESVAGGVTPSGCTSIQDVPATYSGIEFAAAIQADIFDNFLTNGGVAGCTDCHTHPAAGASGHLDLTDGFSWSHLVNAASYDDSSLVYVVPNHPEQSLLFQKINCDNPAEGVRMPYQGYPDGMTMLSPEQQALIYDWIAEGAPVTTTDGIFRNSFDIRGFDQ